MGCSHRACLGNGTYFAGVEMVLTARKRLELLMADDDNPFDDIPHDETPASVGNDLVNDPEEDAVEDDEEPAEEEDDEE